MNVYTEYEIYDIITTSGHSERSEESITKGNIPRFSRNDNGRMHSNYRIIMQTIYIGDTTMKIAICDDEADERGKLSACISEYLNREMIAADIDFFSSAEAFLTGYTPGEYTVIFLDIYMTGMSGIAVAEHIRHCGDEAEIFIITTSEDHFRESYDLRILEYIKKPFEKERIFDAMDRLFRLFVSAKRYLEVVCAREAVKIPYDSILWLDTYNHKTVIHTRSEDYASRSTLEQLSGELPEPPFYKLNKSELVNFDSIVRLEENGLRMKNDALMVIDFSSRYGKKVRALYREYVFSKGVEEQN